MGDKFVDIVNKFVVDTRIGGSEQWRRLSKITEGTGEVGQYIAITVDLWQVQAIAFS